jgi:hypothetical protein
MRKLACLVVLVGCGGGGGGSTDVKPTLSFKDRTDTELSQLINAAGGTEMFMAQSELDQFAGSTDPCPAVAVSGDTITLTGGCTTMDGTTIAGSAVLTNPTAWDQVMYSYQNPSDYELSGFSLTTGSQTMSFDGRITISNSFTVYDADLTSTVLGTSIRSDIHYECDQGSQTCSLSGSGIELVGVGGALVSGSVKNAQTGQTESYTLQGVDTLKATVATGCVAYTISDSSMAKVCM